MGYFWVELYDDAQNFQMSQDLKNIEVNSDIFMTWPSVNAL